MRHPKDMGATEVQAFLTMLAAERQVSRSTHNQALPALLFLHKEVLGMELPWVQTSSTRSNPNAYHRCSRRQRWLRVAQPALLIQCFKSKQTSQPHRNPPLPHPLFRLLHGVFAVVEDACSQHGVSAALLHAVGQVV